MPRIIKTATIPIKIWAGEVEEGAMQQAYNLAALPFAYKHVALMPDVHEGFGMPIGGVLATEGGSDPQCSRSGYWLWHVCRQNASYDDRSQNDKKDYE